MTDQELLAYERDHGDPYRPSRRRKDAAGGPAVLACWGSRKKADREAEVEARRRPPCRTEAPDRRTSVQQREARVEQHRQRECVERGWRQSTRTAKAFRPRLFHGRGPARFGVSRGIPNYVLHDRAALAGRPGFSALQSGFVAIPFTVGGIIGASQNNNHAARSAAQC